MTFTYALLEVSDSTFDEIHEKLVNGGYHEIIENFGNGKCTIDLNGLALVKASEKLKVAKRHK